MSRTPKCHDMYPEGGRVSFCDRRVDAACEVPYCARSPSSVMGGPFERRRGLADGNYTTDMSAALTGRRAPGVGEPFNPMSATLGPAST